MLVKRIWHFFAGYILIEVEGLSIEKFMNLTILKGIYMWNVKRTSYTTLTAYMGIRDFKKLRQIQKKVRCRVKIRDKRGLPFIMHKLKRRKALLIGMMFFLVSIYTISAFIWVVEIEGLETMDEDIIRDTIGQFGILPGSFKGHIDIPYVENRMMIEVPDISWISIEFKGTRAIVRVVEAVKPPDMVDIDDPCNIVATKAGIIHKMIVLEGYPIVGEGDVVEPGQLLVSGILDYTETTGVRYVHAMGEILARTWYETKGEVHIGDLAYVRTGRTVECKYLSLGDYIMDFAVEDIPFERYEVVERKELFFGEGKFIPLEFIVREYVELESLPNDVVLEKAKAEAKRLALESIEATISEGGKIIDKTYKYDIIEGERVVCIIYIEVIEDIGIQEKIIINREEAPIG